MLWTGRLELATFQNLIDPEVPIPEDVQQMHGIIDTIVRGHPTIDQILTWVIEYLGASDIILLTHSPLAIWAVWL
jgi:DNA polymerase III epsilon subunit-like protein